MHFLNSSLEKLVKNLSENDFKYLTKEFGSKHLEFLKQKGAYLYEYMNSFKRFSEEKAPDKECFYSSVKEETTGGNGEKLDGHISNKDYLTCIKNGNEFNMKNMGDYHDDYLKKYVLLLADVFEKFIGTRLKFYKLDPCHYFSSPGLSWDVLLKMTSVKLKKISDICMYLFIEKGLRGGISYIAKRYSEANGKYMKNYEPTKPSRYIEFLDMNNLYGWEIIGYIPCGEFKWLKSVHNFDENSISENSSTKCILEIYLKYPYELPISSRKSCNSLWNVRLL